jgi:uncharacterized membrane-anchored protein
MIRRLLHLAVGAVILAILGFTTWSAERLIASGDEVLLDLAPVDPRSLIQGDYMALAWDLERRVPAVPATGATVVLSLDAKRVGTFRRFVEAGPPGEGEHAFRLAGRADGRAAVEPHSFLFEEGRAAVFATAKYGIFRVDAAGRHLLVGLADGEGRRIDPR